MSSGERLCVTAALGWVEQDGVPRVVSRPRVSFERSTGTIVSITADHDAPTEPGELVHDLGNRLLLPGMVNAHSHAFQRMIRGVAQGGRAGPSPSDTPANFWSWRGAMYSAANTLNPDEVYTQTRACFAEMLSRGITCVGEFHYLHHQPDGRPYDDANELSHQVIRAAREVGLRLCLLEVYYARAGAGHEGPLPEQRRFCDASTDAYLERVDALRELAAGEAGLSVGVAPHSVRAVPADALARIAAYANHHELVIHSHVSEQERENLECREEHRCTPLQVFAQAGCMERASAFTAVHAIHVGGEELELMRKQQVCACPTTEADLGDGVIPASAWHAQGTRLALGSDSNAVIDLIQEARLLEMHERLRDQARLRLRDEQGRVAPTLLDAATGGGAQALGHTELGRLAPGCPFDALAIDLDHPSLRDVPEAFVLDALMLAGTAEPISQVWVGGKRLR